MTDEIKAIDGQFSKVGPAICTIQPMAVCSIQEQCSVCPIARTHLNPDLRLDIYNEIKKIKGVM
jgi:hypothetical protein